MKQNKKMLAIAVDYFKKDSMPISIATKHKHTMELTVMLGGRIEFNSFAHRRDAWDVMAKYNLYFKKLPDGQYEAGTHDPDDNTTIVNVKSTHAISELAYIFIMRKQDSKQLKI